MFWEIELDFAELMYELFYCITIIMDKFRVFFFSKERIGHFFLMIIFNDHEIRVRTYVVSYVH